MDVVSTCPLRVGSILWRAGDGTTFFSFVCKATFDLMPLESPLAEEQDEPNETDSHWDDDETKSLYSASDLAPFKQRADVIVTGNVYAPEGRPVTSLVAGVVVGSVDKSIEVVGDRFLLPNGEIRGPSAFTRMPIRWERAAGGPGTANPVGIRPDAPSDMYGARMLPNFQAPGLYVTGQNTFLQPAGFGPIAPSWPAREGKLYHYAPSFSHRAWNERPLPEIDYRYFNAAPPDQQLDELRGDERLILEHLHPQHRRLATSLRSVNPWALVEQGGDRRMISVRCDTLTIDTNRKVATLTWRGRVMLSHAGEMGRVTIGMLGYEMRAPQHNVDTGTTARRAAAKSPVASGPPPWSCRRPPGASRRVTRAPWPSGPLGGSPQASRSRSASEAPSSTPCRPSALSCRSRRLRPTSKRTRPSRGPPGPRAGSLTISPPRTRPSRAPTCAMRCRSCPRPGCPPRSRRGLRKSPSAPRPLSRSSSTIPRPPKGSWGRSSRSPRSPSK